MTDELDQALQNLEAIKSGTDPRKVQPSKRANDALATAEAEVDRLFEEYAEVRGSIARDNIHVGTARWRGRNGVCKYNKRLDKKRFGERMSSLPRKQGHHVIVINERIFEQGNVDEFIDTVRHELAHAIAYAIHGSSQKHNHHWKAMAIKLGADPKSTHHRRDRSDEFDYYIYCPNCGAKAGRTRRSKVIKQPFNRMCGKCGHAPMSSYESGQEPPEEKGIVKVESLSWSNRDEWHEAGMP